MWSEQMKKGRETRPFFMGRPHCTLLRAVWCRSLQTTEDLAGYGDRLVDLLVAVRGADEAGFVQRRRDVDTAVQQAVEQHVELRGLALHHLRIVLRQLRQQEEAEHAALAVGAESHPFGRGG